MPLSEWDIQINYGVKTGLNEAFIIDGKTKDKLINEDPKSAEIIRPILRGKDIKRYEYNFADMWLLNVHNGILEKNIPPVDIDNYPAVKNYLNEFIDVISVRQDQGDTPYNLRSCAYMNDFSQPKLMYNEITKQLSFCYIEREMYCNNTAYIMSNNPHLKYILACLNSKLYDFYYKTIATHLGGRATRMLAMHMKHLPIPRISSERENEIEITINQILLGNNILQNEDKIDQILYDIVGLSKDEIYYVEKCYRNS